MDLFCTIHTDVEQTWYDAMNSCIDRNPASRLATYDEILNCTPCATFEFRNYWVGVYYRPWIWVQKVHGNVKYTPIYYSSWGESPDDNGDNGCLAVTSSNNSQWVALPCEDTLHHFMCEGTIANGSLPVITEERYSDRPVTLDPVTIMSAILPDQPSTPNALVIGVTIGCGILLFGGIGCAVVKWCILRRRVPGTSGDKTGPGQHREGHVSSTVNVSPYYSEPDTYSSIRDSSIMGVLKKVKPKLPPRENTYNLAFEDTRISFDDIDSDCVSDDAESHLCDGDQKCRDGESSQRVFTTEEDSSSAVAETSTSNQGQHVDTVNQLVYLNPVRSCKVIKDQSDTETGKQPENIHSDESQGVLKAASSRKGLMYGNLFDKPQ